MKPVKIHFCNKCHKPINTLWIQKANIVAAKPIKVNCADAKCGGSVNVKVAKPEPPPEPLKETTDGQG
jgi:hypothetical protein